MISQVKPPVADKPLLRRKSELPTDVYTQVSAISLAPGSEFATSVVAFASLKPTQIYFDEL